MAKAGKITIIIDKKEAKDGRSFYGSSIKGAYINKDLATALGAKDTEFYAVRPVGTMLPQKRGIYKVEFSDSWIDRRKENFPILRIRDAVYTYDRDLREKVEVLPDVDDVTEGK